MSKNDIVYYARILDGRFEVCELKVRTVEEDYFVGVDKRDKHAYLLSYSDQRVFKDRQDALDLVLREEDKYVNA